MKNSVILEFQHNGKTYEVVKQITTKKVLPNSGAAPWKIGTKYNDTEYLLFCNGEYICDAIYNSKFPEIGIKQMKEFL